MALAVEEPQNSDSWALKMPKAGGDQACRLYNRGVIICTALSSTSCYQSLGYIFPTRNFHMQGKEETEERLAAEWTNFSCKYKMENTLGFSSHLHLLWSILFSVSEATSS